MREGVKRASVSGGNCSRDSTRTPRLMLRKPVFQPVESGFSAFVVALRRAKPRASCTIKRGLMPCLQAGMQLPLPLHTSPQRTASALPAPPVIRSTIAPVVSSGSAAASPAGSTIGQARKQSPQRVHASAIAAPRDRNVSRNPAVSSISLIAFRSVLRRAPAMIITQAAAGQCAAFV
jgi:hypothetical protein